MSAYGQIFCLGSSGVRKEFFRPYSLHINPANPNICLMCVFNIKVGNKMIYKAYIVTFLHLAQPIISMVQSLFKFFYRVTGLRGLERSRRLRLLDL